MFLFKIVSYNSRKIKYYYDTKNLICWISPSIFAKLKKNHDTQTMVTYVSNILKSKNKDKLEDWPVRVFRSGTRSVVWYDSVLFFIILRSLSPDDHEKIYKEFRKLISSDETILNYFYNFIDKNMPEEIKISEIKTERHRFDIKKFCYSNFDINYIKHENIIMCDIRPMLRYTNNYWHKYYRRLDVRKLIEKLQQEREENSLENMIWPVDSSSQTVWVDLTLFCYIARECLQDVDEFIQFLELDPTYFYNRLLSFEFNLEEFKKKTIDRFNWGQYQEFAISLLEHVKQNR